MKGLHPYLYFNGNCHEAMHYYKEHIGGSFDFVGKYADMPPQAGFNVDDSNKDQIMHMTYSLPDGSKIMASDVGGEWAPNYQQGNSFSLSLGAESQEEADRIFNALSKDGKVSMPMQKTFWGDYFGTCTDKFGVNWMISFNEQHLAEN
ncbi:VOC family protein [Luteibaculum oceani]|uniref:VOC family protein n=1 Tax=Luteibaculum oceani TaxID=1294296 RepID=A0A5C6UWA5_9FLAO|nr:VOC family protein [Luteibaculum oceani]TXC76934.1 VOC family protein [Luteibaculum oceani]